MAGPKSMKGAELASQLKSTMKFKSSDTVSVDGLRLDDEAMQWWLDARLGLFIHWGLYSLLGRGEWVMHVESIPPAEYEKLVPQFNPVRFNADEWVSIAADAGQKYMVITSRHHDGFSRLDCAGQVRLQDQVAW